MDERIQEFIEYLTDIEATSEISFIQHIQDNNDIFQLEYRRNFEKIIQAKLQQWTNVTETGRGTQRSETTNSDTELKEKEQREDLPSSSENKENTTLKERHVSVVMIVKYYSQLLMLKIIKRIDKKYF
jgi:hypothetical protein